MSKTIEEHGWTAVPRSLEKLVQSRKDPKPSKPMKVADIPLPDTHLVQSVMKYAKEHLPAETFNHSMRVYYYGMIPSQFSTSIKNAHTYCGIQEGQ